MTKRTALKEYNKIIPDDFQTANPYLDAKLNFFVEHYHLLRNTEADHAKLYMSHYMNKCSHMNNIAKISKLVELIKEYDNTPAHNFIIAVCLHRIHKELRKRYKRMSIDNIRLLQMLGD